MITKFDEIFLKIRNEKSEVVMDGSRYDCIIDAEKFNDEHYELIDHIIWHNYDDFFKNGYTISLHHAYGEWDPEDEGDHWKWEEGEELERISFIDKSERESYSETYWIAEHNWKKINEILNTNAK